MSSPVGVSSGTCVACARPCPQPRCSFCGAAQAPGGLRVQRVLSQSVHGRLYLALDAAGRSVAIKELVFAHAPDAEKVEAFERESRLLEVLSHPNIPRLHASFTEGEGAQARFYLVQDYVAGESLAARLEHHRFNEAEVRKLAREVLRILGFLHSRQPPVLHRDVKPANLIRREDGHIVLVDFGSARALRDGRTHEATLNGTFGYMAPEQLGGSVSPVSDLYALGASLLHLLSRRPPETLLSGDWELAFTREIHVSEHFRAFLRKLVARRPEDRFPSASDALLALDAPPERTAPRWPLAAAGAALVVGAVALVSVGREPAPAPAVVAVPSKPVEPPKAPEPPARESPEQESPAQESSPPVTPAGTVLAHWAFEEQGKESLFKSAEGGPALRHSEVDLVPGVRGRAALLGGTGSLVLKPEEGSPVFGIPSEGALSLWLSPERAGAGPVLTTYAGTQRMLQLRLDETGRLKFGVGTRELTSPRPLELGRFVYVALEWGTAGLRLWLDGERVAEDVGPVPGGGLGEGLRIGWDALVPGELAPAMAVDEVRLRSGLLPPETWPQEAGDLARDARVFSPWRPASASAWSRRGHGTHSVELRMEASGDIDLSQQVRWLRGPGGCLRDGRLELEGMEVVTGEKTRLSASFSFKSRTRCDLNLPLFLEDDKGEQRRAGQILFVMERGGVRRVREEFTLSEGERYSVLGVGSHSQPLAKFRIDWATHTVHRVPVTAEPEE